MLALPLRLPTAPYGGHMGHFLLSMLMLSGSAPFGNTTPQTFGHQYHSNTFLGQIAFVPFTLRYSKRS